MTMRQVQVALEKIAIRDHRAFALQASLFGHKVKKTHTNNDFEELELEEGEEEALERAMNNALNDINPSK